MPATGSYIAPGAYQNKKRRKKSRKVNKRRHAQARRQLARARTRTLAAQLGVPTTGPIGRVPTSILRPQIRPAVRTARRVARDRRAYEAENRPAGILERGLIGSAIYETTGSDISDDVRKVLYGTENPTLADLALAAAPGGIGKIIKTGATVAKGAKVAKSAQAAKIDTVALARGAKVKTAKPPRKRATPSQKIAARSNVRRYQKGQRRIAKGKQPKRRQTRNREAGIATAGVAATTTGAGVAALGLALEEKARNVATLPYQLGRATVEDPGQTAKASYTTLRDSLLGLPSAIYQTATDPKQSFEDIKKDYSRRYGPLLEGDFEKFRAGVKETGLTPYAFDALVVAPPVGRAAGALARKGALGPGAKKVATAPRRKLQVTPTKAKEQALSRNLGAAAVQKSLDLARAKRDRRRRAKGRKNERRPALTGRKGTVAPLRPARMMKREVARQKGRYLQAQQAEQLYEVHKGISKESRTKLTAPERNAAGVAIQLGIRTPDQARDVLTTRLTQIAQDRAQRLAADPDYKPPKGSQDNIRLFKDLIENADAAFTPRLAQFAEAQVARTQKAAEGDPAIDTRQAQIRSAAPQAALRGVQSVAERIEPARAELRSLQARRRAGDSGDPVALRAEIKQLKADIRNPESGLRKQADANFLAAAAQARGDLAPGGYFPSQMRHTAFAPFTVGGRRAIAGPKQYKGSLYREGAEDLRMEALAAGVAQNIKRRYNWSLVADTFEDFAYSWSRGDKGKGKSLGEVRKEIQRRGYSEDQVVLWNPSRFRSERAALDEMGEDVGEATVGTTGLQDAITAARAGKGSYEGGRGWVAIPKAAYDEMSASAKQTRLGRALDISTQKQSRILLGAINIPWLQFQVLSNGFLSGLAGAGPFDWVASAKWWHGLDNEQRRALDPLVGLGSFQADVRQTRMGAAANSSMVNAWRGFKDSTGGKYIWRDIQVRDLNPLDLMFRSDNAQNNFFRRAVLYNRVKRDAYQRMGANTSAAGHVQNRFLSAIGKAPPEKQMRQVLEDFPALERHAQHVNDFLGDYVTYTAAERAFMKKNVMFYGFLRFSLRFAFWTMPTRHPVMTGLMGNLSKLKAEETIEMLGGDELPYALGRIRFTDDNTFVDLARANPVTNSLIGVATASGLDSKFFAATGMFPPLYGIALSQVSQRDTFTGKPWKVRGETQPRNQLDVGAGERARIALNQGLSMFYPYRVWNDIEEEGRPVGSDSLAWDVRKTRYEENYKTKQEPAGQRILQETFPLGGLFFDSLREVDRDRAISRSIRQSRAAELSRLGGSSSESSSGSWGSSSSSASATW